MTIAAWKVGFLGSTEGVSAVAEILADYPDVPLVAYLPNLAFVEEDEQQSYLEAFRDLVLPQTEVLVGSHQTLADFLLPDWDGERPPSSRELAVAANKHGTRYVLVTSIPLPDQFLDNVLASPQGAITGEKFERFETTFVGAGETLSAALAALLATGVELHAAVGEALAFLDQALDAGLPSGHGQRHPRPLLLGLAAKTRKEKARARWPRAKARPRPKPRRCRRVRATSIDGHNAELFERARRVIPGGVNSPVRAFRAVGGTPRFIARADGPYMFDVEGKRYIDYIGSWGPMILGHRHPAVEEAVHRAVDEGLSFGAPTEREVELAEAILKHVPSMEQVRLVSSGTEAAMSALRLARGATGRNMIIKFEGCYHGHADALLVKAGSGLATFGHPTSAGVPEAVVQHTLVLEYNNVAALDEAFALHGPTIACVMIEPIAGNMNFVRASLPFMHRLRELCTAHGALLVFDEVMTGFRVGLGGAQALYASALPGFEPDLSVFGKVIGGGMPLAAFGGKRAVMEQLAPLGPVYQAGTLSGNPVATACGLATLREIEKPGFYDALAARTRELVAGLIDGSEAAGVPMVGDCEGGMFGFFFAAELPRRVRRRDGHRCGPLQRLLPRHAGARCLPCARALRSRLRERRPRRRRDRRNPGCGCRKPAPAASQLGTQSVGYFQRSLSR